MSDDDNLMLEEFEDDGDSPPDGDAPDATAAAGNGKGAKAAASRPSAGDGADGPDMDDPIVSELAAIYDIPVQVSAVLGKATLEVNQLLKLGRGAVVELDRKVGEAIDIYVNNRLVARGEVVVVDERLGVTMTEIIKSNKT